MAFDFLGRLGRSEWVKFQAFVTAKAETKAEKKKFLEKRIERQIEYLNRAKAVETEFTGEPSVEEGVAKEPIKLGTLITNAKNPRDDRPNDVLPAILMDDLKKNFVEAIKKVERAEYFTRKALDIRDLLKERLKKHEAEIISDTYKSKFIKKIESLFNTPDYKKVLRNDL